MFFYKKTGDIEKEYENYKILFNISSNITLLPELVFKRKKKMLKFPKYTKFNNIKFTSKIYDKYLDFLFELKKTIKILIEKKYYILDIHTDNIIFNDKFYLIDLEYLVKTTNIKKTIKDYNFDNLPYFPPELDFVGEYYDKFLLSYLPIYPQKIIHRNFRNFDKVYIKFIIYELLIKTNYNYKIKKIFTDFLEGKINFE